MISSPLHRISDRPATARPLDGRPVLLVSPHLDDVILSCEALVGRPEPLAVLTVCTGVPETVMAPDWDLRSGFRDSTQAMTARLAEDDAAFAGTPHERHHLGLLDQQYLPDGRPEGDARVLTEWVERWRSRTGGVVLVPTATGALPWAPGAPRPLPVRVLRKTGRGMRRLARAGAGALRTRSLAGARAAARPPEGPGINGDHRWVRDTLLQHLLDRGAAVGLYEDVPYSYGRPGQAEVELLTRRHGLDLAAHSVAVDRVAKARRVAAYASQVPLLIHKDPPLDQPAGLPRRERYWVPR